jgi:chemotaxis protein MotB
MSGPAAPKPSAAEPAPVVVVKRVGDDHGDHGHHGGAWKIAYADFVTAMMAFFMLLWILGATTEQQRKGIADYFAPTLVKYTQSGAGSNGVLQGRTIRAEDGSAPAAASAGKGVVPQIVPRDLGVGAQRAPADASDPTRAAALAADREAFRRVEKALMERLAADPSLAELREQIRFVQTREGLRIEIIDRAGFSMFELASDRLVPRAGRLMAEVARSIDGLPNPIAVRGHTDSLRYADAGMNNWKLSAYRAEATRAAFAGAGISEVRFARIEGVADTEPFAPRDPSDARNRRITVTLFYRGG